MASSSSSTLLVRRLHPDAVLPKRAHATDAGYDLSSVAALTVEPGKRALVPTGIAIAVPEGTYGRVAPRSGLAAKHGIQVGAGVVDAGYQGEVCVVLFNHGDAPLHVQPGDRVAQLVLERIATPDVSEVDVLPADTSIGTGTDTAGRGAAGFGSTGVAIQ